MVKERVSHLLMTPPHLSSTLNLNLCRPKLGYEGVKYRHKVIRLGNRSDVEAKE